VVGGSGSYRARLVEVAGSECRRLEEVEDVPVDDWSDGLHDVECERVAVGLVGVPDPECRVEAGRVQGECRLGFAGGREVVKERVCRVRGVPLRS